MCFDKSKDHWDAKVATRDIKVVKLFYYQKEILLHAICADYVYCEGKQRHVRINTNKNISAVEKGYHSLGYNNPANSTTLSYSVALVCIIPKGSTYYYNPIGSYLMKKSPVYVSSDLIITKEKARGWREDQ